MFPLSHLIVQQNFLRFLTKVFGLIVQKDYTCPGGFSVEKHVCVRKKSFSLSFLNLERNISIIYLEQFSEELSILLSRCSEERFYKSFSFEKYQVFFLYLAKMRQNFNFERNFYERFATTIVARWTFSVTFFPDEGQILSHLWTLNRKSGFRPIFFRQVCQNCSLLVCMNCLTNFVSWVFFFSGHWPKVFNHVARFSKVLLKLHSEDKREPLRRKLYFFDISFFLPFPGIRRKDLGLLY